MSEPRIFYYCYDHNRPSGDNKSIYRHVDILHRRGRKAYVLHTMPGFRLNWFENTTPVIDLKTCRQIYRQGQDVIVLPEDLGVRILDFPGKKVILNQNLYYGFTAFEKAVPRTYPYLHCEVLAVLTKSEHNSEHLRFAYPKLNVIPVCNGIDPDTYRYCPLRAKKKQIACIVKANPELLTLYHILESRAAQGLNRLQDFLWVFIENRTESEIAACLHDTLLFVFLSVHEGLGRTPLEALLCGCLVAAFGTGPMREYLPAAFQFAPNDLLSTARWIEKVAESFPTGLGEWEAVIRAGRETALQYSMQREEESVLAAWRQIIGS